jgi:hypothetical protein
MWLSLNVPSPHIFTVVKLGFKQKHLNGVEELFIYLLVHFRVHTTLSRVSYNTFIISSFLKSQSNYLNELYNNL